MKISKKWKKTVAALMTAVMLSGSLTVPAMAHGHGGSHHSSYHGSRHTGIYCVYHGSRHKSKTKCSRYCQKHKTIHRNGKKHAVRYHAVHH